MSKLNGPILAEQGFATKGKHSKIWNVYISVRKFEKQEKWRRYFKGSKI
jgi:hypothetical protein